MFLAPLSKKRVEMLDIMEPLTGLVGLILGVVLVLPLEWRRRKRYRRAWFLRNLRVALGACPTCRRRLAG